MKNNYYYDVERDLNEYDNCWLYVVVGGRNTGKTYSSLKYCIENNKKFVFVKRTNKDIQMLCAGHKIGGKLESYSNEVDFSPFKPLNRDLHYGIYAFSIPKLDGVAAFWRTDEEGQPAGAPVGYLASLSSVADLKGFDMSDADLIIFDEFIPQPWERVSRSEGEQIMELYKTVSRDREHRGIKPLKMVALANAVNIVNPLMQVTEITDIVVDMAVKDVEITALEDRGILIHQLHNHDEFDKTERESMLFKAMGETNWGEMAFGNKYAYNDFTNVERRYLKKYKPVCEILYKRNHWYIYRNDEKYYICASAHQGTELYNLNLENDQKRFYLDWDMELQAECIDGNVKFETYVMYDLIVNYKRIFHI